MQTNKDKGRLPRLARGFAVLGAALAVAAPGGASAAPTETVLHSFSCIMPDCRGGAQPIDGLIADSAGNLYGTTTAGGAANHGVVFKLSPGGTETVLHAFTGGSDGANPAAGLIADSAGNFYGTTQQGGASNDGVVFKLSPGGTETVLHAFAGSDGAKPSAGLTADTAGNFYGTTQHGGASGHGVVFKLSPGGTETVLYSFCSLPNCRDGSSPFAGLIVDSAGNLYGTTHGGGASKKGVVFKLSPGGTETVLHAFAGGLSDGATPELAALIADSAGNLYGTTGFGGPSNDGVVFKLSPGGIETVLYPFCSLPSCIDGANPVAGLIADSAGNLYGTTGGGGASNDGVVFKVSPGGTETVLHSFTGRPDGNAPHAGLIAGSAGNLFGTTAGGGGPGCGGIGCGVVFKLAGTGFVAAIPSAASAASLRSPTP